MNELLRLIEEKLGKDFLNYKVDRPDNSNRIVVSNSKVRIVILNWNRAVGFDKICNEAKHHERSRNKSKELIICANRFSDPAIMMGDSAYHKYLTLVDITDLKLSSLVLLK